MDMTNEQIDQVFNTLVETKQALFDAARIADDAKGARETAVAGSIASGEIERILGERGAGKNNDARAALAQELHAIEFDNEERANLAFDEAKLAYDLAYIEKSRLDYFLRLGEIEAHSA